MGSGRWGRTSCAYVACSAPMDGSWVWKKELDDGGDDSGGGDGKPRRSCAEEELVVLNAVL
jgi:hypothetical protein